MHLDGQLLSCCEKWNASQPSLTHPLIVPDSSCAVQPVSTVSVIATFTLLKLASDSTAKASLPFVCFCGWTFESWTESAYKFIIPIMLMFIPVLAMIIIPLSYYCLVACQSGCIRSAAHQRYVADGKWCLFGIYLLSHYYWVSFSDLHSPKVKNPNSFEQLIAAWREAAWLQACRTVLQNWSRLFAFRGTPSQSIHFTPPGLVLHSYLLFNPLPHYHRLFWLTAFHLINHLQYLRFEFEFILLDVKKYNWEPQPDVIVKLIAYYHRPCNFH